MKTILEITTSEHELSLLQEIMKAMNIRFKAFEATESVAFKDEDVRKAIDKCVGIWKDRDDFSDFAEFGRQAWKNRGV